jgi:hypothetical protein
MGGPEATGAGLGVVEQPARRRSIQPSLFVETLTIIRPL